MYIPWWSSENRPSRVMRIISPKVHQVWDNQICILFQIIIIKSRRFTYSKRQLGFKIFCHPYINKTLVRGSLENHAQDPLLSGRHQAFDLGTENSILVHIYKQNGQCCALMPKEFLQFIRKHCAPQLTKGWMHAFLDRHRDAIHICYSLLQEKPDWLFRVNISKIYPNHERLYLRKSIWTRF
jgi:hypothetical protein